MIETVENAAQLVVVGISCCIAFVNLLRRRSRIWLLLGLSYGSFLLGLLYWLLYLLFYGDTPHFRYISELSWYTAYLLLYMMLHTVSDSEERSVRSRIPFLLLLFAAGMCVFYMQCSSVLSNLIALICMSMLLFHSSRGLIYHRNKKGHGKWCRLYALTLLFCSAEYSMWTVTCIYWTDTFSNPYFWFDILQTICFPLFLPAAAGMMKPEKAVGET